MQTVVLKAEDQGVDKDKDLKPAESSIRFLNATEAKATAKEKLEAAKKAKPYDQTLVNELQNEVGLARTYKAAQEAYDKDTKHKNPALLINLNLAKKAYEDYVKAKSAEESTGDASRRNSDASSAAGSTRVLTKRKSFYEQLTGSSNT